MWVNEIDPFPAAWQRALMVEGFLGSAEVDERSIEDVTPAQLMGHRRCHFFSGIGVWELALERAGWPRDLVTWTGSCPCQPFSPAGKRAGFADERHLWPLWFHLIEHCEPECILGEQVEGKDGRAWLDLVFADLEGLGYSCGAVVAPAAGFGAPHIRSRLYWVAVAERPGLEGHAGHGDNGHQPGRVGAVARGPTSAKGAAGGLADAPSIGRDEQCRAAGCTDEARGSEDSEQPADRGGNGRPGPTNGLWDPCDWLLCRDQKWRPVEPGTFPLADAGTVRNRVGALRGAGNALALAQAVAFVESVMEVIGQ